MTAAISGSASPLPAVDKLLRNADLAPVLAAHGRSIVLDALRDVLAAERARLTGPAAEPGYRAPDEAALCAAAAALVTARVTPSLRRVFNLTGTVLHTNLGRALLPASAIAHVGMALAEPCNLEYDIASGARGERDSLVEGLLANLTGAEAVTVVNNNAAAVLLVLAALAPKKEIIVSRGELVEIGGAFRIPDVMRSANARLVEVGTTNRTHPADYANAIGPRTAALMKVHTSNYRVTGFTAEVTGPEVARIAHERGLPYLVDLGAGSLVDLKQYGLPPEPVVRDVLAEGADVVTFSGDKLLSGPQAGLIVGRKDLMAKIRKHPLKRALRVSKLTLAALEASLLCYRHPERLTEDLPTLRLLTRPRAEMAAMAERLRGPLAEALGARWQVDIAEVKSQVGSGSMPIETLPSVALVARVAQGEGRRSGSALHRLARTLRGLPVPVIGRIADDALVLDLRCLVDEDGLRAQLAHLRP